jgi:hypothetical protein
MGDVDGFDLLAAHSTAGAIKALTTINAINNCFMGDLSFWRAAR